MATAKIRSGGLSGIYAVMAENVSRRRIMPNKTEELIADLLALAVEQLAVEQFERGRQSSNQGERDCCYANAASYAKEAAAALGQSKGESD